jgi:hypothetical protein
MRATWLLPGDHANRHSLSPHRVLVSLRCALYTLSLEQWCRLWAPRPSMLHGSALVPQEVALLYRAAVMFGPPDALVLPSGRLFPGFFSCMDWRSSTGVVLYASPLGWATLPRNMCFYGTLLMLPMPSLDAFTSPHLDAFTGCFFCCAARDGLDWVQCHINAGSGWQACTRGGPTAEHANECHVPSTVAWGDVAVKSSCSSTKSQTFHLAPVGCPSHTTPFPQPRSDFTPSLIRDANLPPDLPTTTVTEPCSNHVLTLAIVFCLVAIELGHMLTLDPPTRTVGVW